MKSSEFITEVVHSDSQRVIHFNKDNPPSGQQLVQALITNLNKPENKLSAEKLIDAWNKMYGLNYSLRTLAAFARGNDFIRTQFQQALAKSARL